MDDIAAKEANRVSARRDLETKASVTPLDDRTFVIDAAIRILDRSSEPPQITITAVSRENGLDNDPDPTNNTITLELSP